MANFGLEIDSPILHQHFKEYNRIKKWRPATTNKNGADRKATRVGKKYNELQ